MPAYDRGDIVLVNYPFVTDTGVQQKLRPALVVSDHAVPRRFPDDVMLAAITSRPITNPTHNEFVLDSNNSDFASTELNVTSVVRLDLVVTIPSSVVNRKLGSLTASQLQPIDTCLQRSLGLK